MSNFKRSFISHKGTETIFSQPFQNAFHLILRTQEFGKAAKTLRKLNKKLLVISIN